MQLCEKYRPRKLADMIGQDKAVKQIETIAARCGGLGGQVFFLSGPPGSGKTTLAKIIADTVADDMATYDLAGPDVTAEFLAEMKRRVQYVPIGGRGWAIIVNEVQSFTRGQVDRLNDLIEAGCGLNNRTVWIFTTTTTGGQRMFDGIEESPAFLSRANKISTTPRGSCPLYAQHLIAVARQEGLLNGHPDEYYLPKFLKVMKEERNNLRAGFQWLQSADLTGGTNEQ
jgi:replication-associated recombination protein RarA